MEIKIVEIGVQIEIRITVNGVRFYTHENFETEEEARLFLSEHGLSTTSN
jgi:hypothetical protein